MKLNFDKYQGTGNDFIMINAINQKVNLSLNQIKQLCDRRFGIGADGLIILTRQDDNFYMKYYNSDGNESTMCGNGGRCFLKFLFDLNYFEKNISFSAIDGEHAGYINNDHSLSLQLKNIDDIKKGNDFIFLDTGSPHHVMFKENVDAIDVKKQGSKIRYSKQYPDGTNVNFVEVLDADKIKVRTYERGVEDETFSCGTGVVASAIAANFLSLIKNNKITIETKGGTLYVSFTSQGNHYNNVWLTGPAKKVFTGQIEI